jgi:acrylyl-CoA reductase (NADPH)
MTEFKAFRVEKNEAGVSQAIVGQSTDDLPAGDLLIEVKYSSVNYKDALSAKGLPGVTRNYPHTPGIDAAGTVIDSTHSTLQAGDQVIVIGFDLGMNTPGGYGQYIRVPAGWAVKLPKGLSLRDSMILGTAGLTAALCVEKLERMGARPTDGPVVVTGATGGVGSVAVALLAELGYDVVASSGKSEKAGYLKSLGASSVIGREVLGAENKRPLLAQDYAHGIDAVGGDTLGNLLKHIRYGGSVASCGLVASATFPGSVLPFILRNINLLGVDSVELPVAHKAEMWKLFAGKWQLGNLPTLTQEIRLEQLPATLNAIFEGKLVGRALVVHD